MSIREPRQRIPQAGQNNPENPDKPTRTDTRARMAFVRLVRPDTRANVSASECPGFVSEPLHLLVDMSVCDAWGRAFVAGCQRHVDRGGALSLRQREVLTKLASRGLCSTGSDSHARAFAEFAR